MPWSGGFNDPEWLALERPLVERARRGDARAFGRLYEEFADVLFRQVLMPRLGDRALAEEALGETFRSAFEQLPRFESREVSVYFWIARIAQNKATDAQREQARRGKSSASFEALLGPLRAPADTPEALAERRDELDHLRARVAEVLGRVNPRYRRAIELRLFEERSRAECAGLLEVTVPTFDVLFLRALRAFRKEWEGA